MNDFTKEELIDLNVIISVWHAKYIEDKEIGKLSEKIQTMIDNYCDHDGEIGKDYPAEKCMKCNKMWE